MFIETSKAHDSVSSAVAQGTGTQELVGAKGRFDLVCRDSEGNIKWTETIDNLVVNVGLQDMNTQYFTGSAYTAAWYLGLWGASASNNPAASDTMSSHAGWTEVTAYSQATRPACTFGTASTANPSVISNSGSAATFSINATTTVGGAFLTSNNTKGGTTGVLFSGSDFTSPGDHAVVSGDTVTVTYTFSLTAT